ncbi:hypothetical protein NHQ30_004049 [Ciborinia camelliae]|nr:hypothetical protein NHQ30_004049 [Ciborinia camelliae]
MSDPAVSPKGGQEASRPYQSVLPELGRRLLSQHLLSVDGKVVTVDEFAAAVEKSTRLIQSKKVFRQLQILRPDYIQFLIDRETWETFCGGPTQKENPNYRPFPAKDPRRDDPIPQYFDPGTLTPDSYGLMFRDNVHPDCPSCSCTATQANVNNQSVNDDGGIRISTPQQEYAGFQERLEEQSRKLGFRDSDERWEKECEIEQAKEDQLEQELATKTQAELEAKKQVESKEVMPAERNMASMRKRAKKGRIHSHSSRCSTM